MVFLGVMLSRDVISGNKKTLPPNLLSFFRLQCSHFVVVVVYCKFL